MLDEKNKKAPAEDEEKDKVGVDVVDERGFVDGVKVARKVSKANVLGKAVEYIRYVTTSGYGNLSLIHFLQRFEKT